MGVLFIQLSVCFAISFFAAAALFYLAELVEEYTVITAKVIKGTVAVSCYKLLK